ncbi:extracellular solute-binding protein [Microlunatus parietis]|uniref:Putative aldouronate transport system substrate-binding protein n=1 Tax=Microlunatus parietis TaxID=682979 RepID=A0A7Y9LEW2_9ACTN|nr:extracellular solute-binding protein [Microlunatus parietis]NYE73456.1 putative aldouronate transport system substrate-binding protein [Microlunatus parietis]
MTRSLSRRTLLRTGLSAAAVATAGVGLAGCTTASRTSEPANDPAAKAAAVPDYRPFPDRAKPDLPGNEQGVLDAYLHYPAEVKPATDGVPGDGQPISGLAQLNAALPPAVGQHPYWQELNRRLGSELKMQLVNAGNDFNSKIATMAAGNDFPDLMQVNNSIPSLARFLEAKMIDLTPHLSGDNVAAYPALANLPTKFWEAAVFNGKLLALPISRGIISSMVLYYRADLLDAAGVDAKINSFEDLYQRAKAGTDPKQGRWGFGANPLSWVRQMLGIPNGWQQTDGGLVHQLEDERQAEALEAVRRLQAEGLLNPDLAGAPPSQQQQWFGAGRSVFYLGTYSAWSSLVQNFGVPADTIDVLPMTGFDGGTPTTWMGPPNNNLTVIPKSAEPRIETILKIANYLASPFGSEENLFISRGIRDRHYRLDGSDPIALPEHAGELGLGAGYLAAPPPVVFGPNITGYAEKAHASQQKFVEYASADLAQTYYSETASRRGPTLATMIAGIESDIVYGRKPVSDWAGTVDRWRTDGGDKIREELQAAIHAAG